MLRGEHLAQIIDTLHEMESKDRPQRAILNRRKRRGQRHPDLFKKQPGGEPLKGSYDLDREKWVI